MNQKKITCLAILATLIAIGVASRVGMIDLPNFKPVAAIALFSGFLFRRYLLAAGVVLGIMLLSDFQIGSFDWKISGSVYASLLLFAAMGGFIRRAENKRLQQPTSRSRQILWSLSTFGCASLVMSGSFFVLTNGAFWIFSGIYPLNFVGLVSCYEAGLPFFRWTLMGDLAFTTALVCVYQSVLMVVESREFAPGRFGREV